MATFLNLLLIFFSILGMADAGYITYEEFILGVTPQCANIPGFDCGAVLDSPWAYIGPIPLSVLGLGFYSVMFLLGCYLLIQPKKYSWLPGVSALFGIAAFLFSLFLMYLQAFTIGAFCLYCTISAGTSTLIFFTTTAYYLTLKRNTHDSSAQ